jgi:hypothetical protein
MLLDHFNFSVGMRGSAVMEHVSLSLRKLTRRVTELGKQTKSPAKETVRMAEQEEDFSALPLPDRFQHKVVQATPHKSHINELTSFQH